MGVSAQAICTNMVRAISGLAVCTDAVSTVSSEAVGAYVVRAISGLAVCTDAVSTVSSEAVGADVVRTVSSDTTDISVGRAVFCNDCSINFVVCVNSGKCKGAAGKNRESEAEDQFVSFHGSCSRSI
ncbi:hypothetical protein SAMN05216197_102350 [Pseudomonas graminis]|uniref:Uncharacterized protein n=1 Tax=Pseudomonas graminis TaxID=158627 RepID=A0A1H9ZNN6_9PSED|nr:hypothetical protein SAMN05216197_102350 [Pseudomonas graminis]